MNFTPEAVAEFVRLGHLDCEQLRCGNETQSTAIDVVQPKSDLWLLTLSDCNCRTCFENGLSGTWQKIDSIFKKPDLATKGRVGHSAVLIDGKLFVFGGFGVVEVNEAVRVVFRQDIEYCHLDRREWNLARGQNVDVFEFFSQAYRWGVFKTCALGKRVIASVPRYSPDPDAVNVTFKLVSYHVDKGEWIDHHINLPFEDDAMFRWEGRVIITRHVAETYVINPRLSKDTTKVYASEILPGCAAGHYSLNWSAELCILCPKGYFSSAGAVLCTKCGGLSTNELGATSINSCACDDRYCENGRCLVAKSHNNLAAECKCNFGYSGERCEFPTLLISIFAGIAAFVVTLILSVFVRKLVTYRKAKMTREYELEEMNRAWTINCNEVFLLQSADSSAPGSYGDVYKARYRDMVVAVKKLKVIMRNARIEREFEREIHLMKSIRHPNIVLFIGAGKYDDEEGCHFLVLEFKQGGSLTSVLRESEMVLSLEQRIRFCLHASMGIRFLHGLNPPRIHRDIKSSNLLLSEHWVVKVADFGCARLVKREGLSQRVVPRERRTPFNVTDSDVSTPLLLAERDMSSDVGAVL